MSEILEQSSTANSAAEPATATAPEARGWTRAHTITLLIVLSLVPGLVAGAAREWWHTLPATVRIPAYVVSGILIVVSCGLILVREQSPPDRQP